MKDFILQKQWNWFASGLALGTVFLLAVILVKPIGVSTQFVILDAIIWDVVSDDVIVKDAESKSGYSSSNEYLNKNDGKYAKNAANPINYSFIFVIAMIFGGFIASKAKLSKVQNENIEICPVWKERYGSSTWIRILVVFFGGMLVLFGARLAGGCTSGHMMSGMMQTSISGYLFALGVFVVAIPVSIVLYKGVEK